MDAAALRPQTDLMDDTEKHDTIAKVTDRLAARYPDAPRPLIAQVGRQDPDLHPDSGRKRRQEQTQPRVLRPDSENLTTR